jgi:hypothetical protein
MLGKCPDDMHLSQLGLPQLGKSGVEQRPHAISDPPRRERLEETLARTPAASA